MISKMAATACEQASQVRQSRLEDVGRDERCTAPVDRVGLKFFEDNALDVAGDLLGIRPIGCERHQDDKAVPSSRRDCHGCAHDSGPWPATPPALHPTEVPRRPACRRSLHPSGRPENPPRSRCSAPWSRSGSALSALSHRIQLSEEVWREDILCLDPHQGRVESAKLLIDVLERGDVGVVGEQAEDIVLLQRPLRQAERECRDQGDDNDDAPSNSSIDDQFSEAIHRSDCERFGV